MKKIRKLSVSKKKKVSQVDEVSDNVENEQTAISNQSKNHFSQTLKKKFFPKKSYHRSKTYSECSTVSRNVCLDENNIAYEEKERLKSRNSNCFETIHEPSSSMLMEINGNAREQVGSSHSDVSTTFPDGREVENNNSNHELLSSDDVFYQPNPPNCSHFIQPEQNVRDPRRSFSSSNVCALKSYQSNTVREFQRLAKQGWYWGPLTRLEAEEKLQDTEDGSFLVRDSSDERYLLSLSFRSFGRTLHTRIEHSSGRFSFYNDSGHQAYTSVVELMEVSMCESQHSGVFCYSSNRSPESPTLPVRLNHPVSRLSQVRSLQYLCRFVIRQFTRIDHIQELPLPNTVKGYVKESYF